MTDPRRVQPRRRGARGRSTRSRAVREAVGDAVARDETIDVRGETTLVVGRERILELLHAAARRPRPALRPSAASDRDWLVRPRPRTAGQGDAALRRSSTTCTRCRSNQRGCALQEPQVDEDDPTHRLGDAALPGAPTGPSARCSTCSGSSSAATRPDAHPDAGRLGRPPAAQGLPASEEEIEFTIDARGGSNAAARDRNRRARSAGRMTDDDSSSDPGAHPRRSRRWRHDAQHGAAAPGTHGVLRLVLELDGETVVRCEPVIGYLHTGIEKTFEAKTYLQGVVLTDRMDYLAPLSNNLVYALAVEKLFGVEVPRARQVVARDPGRADAHQLAPGLARHAGARPRRDERLPLLLPRARDAARHLRDG